MFVAYRVFADAVARGLDMSTIRQKVMLVDDSYEPDLEMDATVADVRHAEVAASGSYRSGGQELTLHPSGLGYAPATWTAFTGEFRYAIFVDSDSGGLIHYCDVGRQRVNGMTVHVEGPEAEPVQPAALESVDDLLELLL